MPRRYNLDTDKHRSNRSALRIIGPLILGLGVLLTVIGLIGFLTRKNMIIMFLCTELMFQAAALALIAFGRHHLGADGQTFVIFVLCVAAAEAAMALALVVLLFRHRESLGASAWKELNG